MGKPTDAIRSKSGNANGGPDIEGELETRGSSLMGKWQEQHFRVENGILEAFDIEDTARAAVLKQISLKEITNLDCPAGTRECVFDAEGKRIRLRAKTEDEAYEWYEAFRNYAPAPAAAGSRSDSGPGSEAPASVSSAMDVFLQVHTLYNLPISSASSYSYMVKALWQNSEDDYAVTEERFGTPDPDSGTEECKVLQQLMLSQAVGEDQLEVGIFRKAPTDQHWDCIAKCNVSCANPDNQQAQMYEFVDWDGEPCKITAKMKLKLPEGVVIGQPPSLPKARQAGKKDTPSSQASRGRAESHQSLTRSSTADSARDDRFGKGTRASLARLELSHALSPQRERGIPDPRRDPQAPRRYDEWRAKSNEPLNRGVAAKVQEMHDRHALKIERQDTLRKLKEAEEDAEYEHRRQERIASHGGDMNPDSAAARLHEDSNAQRLRRILLQQKYRHKELETLEQSRAKPRDPSRELSPEDKKAEALRHTNWLHALHQDRLNRHNEALLQKDVTLQLSLEGSQIFRKPNGGHNVLAKVPQAKIDAMHYISELRREWREEEARVAKEEEDRNIRLKCCCGRMFEEGEDRCKRCLNPAYRPEILNRPHDDKVCEKLHGEIHNRIARLRERQIGKELNEAQALKQWCSCGAEVGDAKKCRKCGAIVMMNLEQVPANDDEIERISSKLHNHHSVKQSNLDVKRKREAEAAKQRIKDTCAGCGFDLSSCPDPSVPRCPRCRTLRVSDQKAEALPDDWVSDRLVASLVVTVVSRSGHRPAKASRIFSSLGKSLHAAVAVFKKAGLYSRSKSVGYSELTKKVSMRCYNDGTLMSDIDGARQCCEPDPVRQLCEDLTALLYTAERAQDVLLMRIARGRGQKATHMDRRWPAGCRWERPAISKKALFAYNPGIKSRTSAYRKALVLYGASEGPRMFRHLMDLSRVCVVFEDCESLRRGLEDVLADFPVLDIRNYYHSSCNNVLGIKGIEVLVALKGEDDGVPFPFVCEIRLEELCYFRARNLAQPHLDKIYEGFRVAYEDSGKDLDGIEYIAKYALHRPGDPHGLRLFRRHLAKRFGSPVAAFRSFLVQPANNNHVTAAVVGAARLIPFLQFREACCELDKRDATVEYWRAMDPGMGGCISLYDLDPEAVALLSRLYLALAKVNSRDEAAVEKMLLKMAKGPKVKGLGLFSVEAFRAAMAEFGFSCEESRKAFAYLDMHRSSKWSKPGESQTSAYITIKDIMWLMRLPEFVYLEGVTLTANYEKPLTSEGSKILLERIREQAELSMSPRSAAAAARRHNDGFGGSSVGSGTFGNTLGGFASASSAGGVGGGRSIDGDDRCTTRQRLAQDDVCSDFLLTMGSDKLSSPFLKSDASRALRDGGSAWSPNSTLRLGNENDLNEADENELENEDDATDDYGVAASDGEAALSRAESLLEVWSRRSRESSPRALANSEESSLHNARSVGGGLQDMSKNLVADWARPDSPIGHVQGLSGRGDQATRRSMLDSDRSPTTSLGYTTASSLTNTGHAVTGVSLFGGHTTSHTSIGPNAAVADMSEALIEQWSGSGRSPGGTLNPADVLLETSPNSPHSASTTRSPSASPPTSGREWRSRLSRVSFDQVPPEELHPDVDVGSASLQHGESDPGSANDLVARGSCLSNLSLDDLMKMHGMLDDVEGLDPTLEEELGHGGDDHDHQESTSQRRASQPRRSGSRSRGSETGGSIGLEEAAEAERMLDEMLRSATESH